MPDLNILELTNKDVGSLLSVAFVLLFASIFVYVLKKPIIKREKTPQFVDVLIDKLGIALSPLAPLATALNTSVDQNSRIVPILDNIVKTQEANTIAQSAIVKLLESMRITFRDLQTQMTENQLVTSKTLEAHGKGIATMSEVISASLQRISGQIDELSRTLQIMIHAKQQLSDEDRTRMDAMLFEMRLLRSALENQPQAPETIELGKETTSK